MKKAWIVLCGLIMIFVLFALNTPTVTQAYYSTTTVKNPLAPNEWQGGTETTVDLVKYPAPEWLEMKANPVKVTTPGEICHEFRGIRYHWVPEIRQLKDGKWVKLETIGSWVPDEEGVYVVCAQAPTAGTYGLFAYYNGPKEYDEPAVV